MTATATDWSGSDCLFPTGLPSVVYLTGVSTELTRAVAPTHETLGLLCTPDSSVHNQAPLYRFWSADNGCFAEALGKTWDADRWLRWLESQTHQLNSCLFAALPDHVGNAAASIERGLLYADRVRSLGYPAALVAQNGLQDLDIPWDRFDALFIGGSPECRPCGYIRPIGEFKRHHCPTCGGRLLEWKLSEDAIRLGAEARDRGLWSHLGRCNTWKRLQWANSAGFDSADGTLLAFGPDVNGPKLLSWLDRLARQRPFTRLEMP